LFSPSGRLPVSFPASAGQLPVYYNQKAGVTPHNYCDQAGLHKPLFSFGDGLGYSKITYSGIALNQLPVPSGTLPVDESPLVQLCMQATNCGSLDESAVPLLFVTDMEADVVRRVMELKAFRKVLVPAGESRTVTLTLHACDLAVWNQHMRLELQRGAFLLRLCDGGKTVWQDTWVL
jgi:beta-glucosidase